MDEQRNPTAFLTIRKLDAALKERLRVRAAQHGHSMEAEVRDILMETLKDPASPAEELRRLKGDGTGAALIAALQKSPYRETEIVPRHERMPVRDVQL
jgi:plasmid stability protein